jgi:hypothetical protein
VAGGDYGRVRHTFWTDPDIKRTLTAEQKALLLYFFTSPHSNLIGLYHCPLEYAAVEVGLPAERVREWVQGPLSRFLTYDEETEEVLVHRFARHQVAETLAATDKRMKRVVLDLAAAHSRRLVTTFLSLYSDWDVPFEGPSGSDGSPFEAPSKDLASPLEGPSKPLRSHSIAEHSSSIAGTNASHSARGADVENSAEESRRANAPDRPTDAEIHATLAPLIRRHLWLGSRPPPDVLASDPKWSMSRELNLAKQLLREGFSLDELAGAIEVCREVDYEDGPPRDRPVTMRFFVAAGRTGRLRLAVHAWRQRQERDALRAATSGPRTVGEVLRVIAAG